MTNIYVGNLAYGASEDDLREAFERFGQVDSVQIIKDREIGRSRGLAFVEMTNENDAKEAIEQLDSTALQAAKSESTKLAHVASDSNRLFAHEPSYGRATDDDDRA